MGQLISALLKHFVINTPTGAGIKEFILGINPMWLLLLFILAIYIKLHDLSDMFKKADKRVKVTLVDKQELDEWVVQKVEPTYYKKKRYVLVFQAENKKSYRIDVLKGTFGCYDIGDKGKLTYRTVKNETRFVGFVKQKKQKV